MRRASFVRILTLSILFGACSKNGRVARLEIEVAPVPSPEAIDEAVCDPRSGVLPGEVDCVTVTACERTQFGCDPVPLIRPEGDHGAEGEELRFPRGTTPTLRFDVPLRPEVEHEIEIVLYAGGVPYARGIAGRVRTDSDLVRVRLEVYGTWVCAGPREDGTRPASRALHRAVSLPNGEVLLLGGVGGQNVSANSLREGGPAGVRAVEVYDPAVGRFFDVQVVDVDGEPGLSAVFHEAFYLGEQDGGYRVRIQGGFSTPADAVAARFDSIQGGSLYSSPLIPGPRSVARPSVDLVYFPQTRRGTITAVESDVTLYAGFDDTSAPDENGSRWTVLGLSGGGGDAQTPTPMLAGRWYTIGVDGIAGPANNLGAPRFGATVSRLTGTRALVWGGDVTARDEFVLQGRAGEFIGDSPGLLSVHPGLPRPTALHSATAVRGGTLIAGGIEVAPLSGVAGGMSTTPSTQPFTVITFDSSSGFVMGTPLYVDPTVAQSTILHATLTLPDGSAVIAGGSSRREVGGLPPSQLWAERKVVRIVPGVDGATSYSIVPLASSILPRWGAALAQLPGDRLLLTGGFVRGMESPGPLRAYGNAEILTLATPPATISACEEPTQAADGGL